MKAKTRLYFLGAVLVTLFMGSNSAVAIENTQNTNCQVPKLTVQDLTSRIDALKVEKDACRRENLRILYDNVAHGKLTTADATKLEERLGGFVQACKKARLW